MKKRRTLIVALLLVAALALGIGYAGFTSELSIGGEAILLGVSESKVVIQNVDIVNDVDSSGDHIVAAPEGLGTKSATIDVSGFAELDELAASVPAGSCGLTFLPYLCGSTMPKYNPDARGSFTGLTTEHNRAHFVRSVMEAVSCMLKSNLDYLGLEVEEIRAMGGGANSPLWCQMKADMTGKRLVTLKNKETACLGSAILAGAGVGVFASCEEAAKMIELSRVYESQGTDYTECYERYLAADKLLNVTK